MSELADKRRATRLMGDALDLALTLINEDVWAARQIVVRTYPFVEHAARKWPKEYTAAEKARVWAGVRDRCAQLAATEREA